MTAFSSRDGAPLPFDGSTLDTDTACICVLDHALRLTYVNAVWRERSASGGDWSEVRWQLGSAILAAIPGAHRPLFEELFARARASRAPVDHSYECVTTGGARRYRIRIFPCHESAFVVTCSPARVLPSLASHAPDAAVEAIYRGAYGFIVQCSHCCRVQRLEERALYWDWVPEYVVRNPPSTSHGLCQLCGDYFYGIETQSERDALASAPAGPAAILLVESAPDARALMTSALRSVGHRVTEACGHAEALGEAERRPFDLVLLRLAGAPQLTAGAFRALDPATRVLVSGDPDGKPFDAGAFLAEVHGTLGPLG